MKKIKVVCYILLYFNCGAFAQNAEELFLITANVHRNKSLDPFFKTITNTSVYVSFANPVIELAKGYATKNKALILNGYVHTASLLASFVFTATAKRVIKRDRPYLKLTQLQPYQIEGDFSFPSGHTSNAFTAAGNLAFAYKKWYVVAPAYIWAASVGYSRMHLGVHYPTDVLVGAILGTASAYICNRWQNKIFNKKVQKLLYIPTNDK